MALPRYIKDVLVPVADQAHQVERLRRLLLLHVARDLGQNLHIDSVQQEHLKGVDVLDVELVAVAFTEEVIVAVEQQVQDLLGKVLLLHFIGRDDPTAILDHLFEEGNGAEDGQLP